MKLLLSKKSVFCLLATLCWQTFAKNNLDLVADLKRKGFIKSEVVERTMLAIDRKKYCPNDTMYAYDDISRDIGYSASMSAPHLHAQALELLKDHLVNGQTALDIGSGSGYLTVCMAIMLGENGVAVGVEHIPELVAESYSNIQKNQPWLISTGRVRLYVSDGKEGYKKHSPYSAIYIGGAIPQIPQTILDQLNSGGRLVAPVGIGTDQYLTVVDKNEQGWISTKRIRGVSYPPLMEKDKQLALNTSSRRKFSNVFSLCRRSPYKRKG